MKTYLVGQFTADANVADWINANAQSGYVLHTFTETLEDYTAVMVKEEPEPERTEEIRRTFQAALDALNAIDDPRCIETGLHIAAKHLLHQLRGMLPDVLARPEGSEAR